MVCLKACGVNGMTKGDLILIAIIICSAFLFSVHVYERTNDLEKRIDKLEMRIHHIESTLKDSERDIQTAYYKCVNRNFRRAI